MAGSKRSTEKLNNFLAHFSISESCRHSRGGTWRAEKGGTTSCVVVYKQEKRKETSVWDAYRVHSVVGERGWCEVQCGVGEGGLEVCGVRKGGVESGRGSVGCGERK